MTMQIDLPRRGLLATASAALGAFTLGFHVPLAYDGYFAHTLGQANRPPLSASLGTLDPIGGATIRFSLPAGLSSVLAGLVLHHAPIVFSASGTIHLTGNPVPVRLY